MRDHIRVLWKLYLYHFLAGLLFVVPVWSLYYQFRGMGFGEMGLFAGLLYAFSLVLEYPSGVVADKFGRKFALIISQVLYLSGLLVVATGDSVLQFCVAASMMGAGFAFNSGSETALRYEILKANGLEKKNSETEGIKYSLYSAAGLIAAPIGGLLFSLNPTIPFFATAVVTLFAIVSLLLVREPDVEIPDDKNELSKWQDFKEGFSIVARSSFIKSLILVYAVLFLFEEIWMIIQQPTIVSLGFPLVLIGVFVAVDKGFSIVSGLFLPKLMKKFDTRLLLVTAFVIEIVCLFVFSSNLLVVVMIFAVIFRQVHFFWNCLESDVIHDHIPSRKRSSALSAKQFIISAVWVFNPIVLGYLVDYFTREVFFFGAGVILVVLGVAVLVWRWKKL